MLTFNLQRHASGDSAGLSSCWGRRLFREFELWRTCCTICWKWTKYIEWRKLAALLLNELAYFIFKLSIVLQRRKVYEKHQSSCALDICSYVQLTQERCTLVQGRYRLLRLGSPLSAVENTSRFMIVVIRCRGRSATTSVHHYVKLVLCVFETNEKCIQIE